MPALVAFPSQRVVVDGLVNRCRELGKPDEKRARQEWTSAKSTEGTGPAKAQKRKGGARFEYWKFIVENGHRDAWDKAKGLRPPFLNEGKLEEAFHNYLVLGYERRHKGGHVFVANVERMVKKREENEAYPHISERILKGLKEWLRKKRAALDTVASDFGQVSEKVGAIVSEE